MEVTFCGVRGSMASAGAEFARYGGHTSCVAVAHDGGPPALVLDAGTGLRRITAMLADEPFRGSILLGHLHWDHVHGMPFFRAGAREGARVDVSLPMQGEDAEELLAQLMSPPAFPIRPSDLGPGWRFRGIDEGWHDVEGFRVLAREIPHKGGRTFGYRVEDGRSSVAYLSDHDPLVVGPGPSGLGAHHAAALALADGVDLLIHDAQLTATELPRLGHLGHAAAEYAVELATAAGAGAVALYHHGPERTDDELDSLATTWTRLGTNVLLAVEEVRLHLPAPVPLVSH